MTNQFDSRLGARGSAPICGSTLATSQGQFLSTGVGTYKCGGRLVWEDKFGGYVCQQCRTYKGRDLARGY